MVCGLALCEEDCGFDSLFLLDVFLLFSLRVCPPPVLSPTSQGGATGQGVTGVPLLLYLPLYLPLDLPLHSHLHSTQLKSAASLVMALLLTH